MELNTEQIGIRTTKAIKMQFEAIEGATSHDKLKTLIEGHLSLKNASESQIDLRLLQRATPKNAFNLLQYKFSEYSQPSRTIILYIG